MSKEAERETIHEARQRVRNLGMLASRAEQQVCAVPISEQTQRLLGHYEEAATALGHWCNQIPVAIREWGERRAATPPVAPMNALAQEANEINRANGWNVLTPSSWSDPYHIPAVLALIHSEVSEALEGFRAGDRENVAEEVADVVIRCLDMAGGLGIDLDAEVRAKLEKNRGRGYKHGGKRI